MNRKLLVAAALAALLPVLQGCVTAAAVGAGAAVAMWDDRRTTGVYVEDENIEWKALAKIMGDFKNTHVNATSYNRRVLLTGEAPNEETKKKVEEAVRALENVKEVTNELQVAGASSTSPVTRYAWATSLPRLPLYTASKSRPADDKAPWLRGASSGSAGSPAVG